jgi:hypothetical protein
MYSSILVHLTRSISARKGSDYSDADSIDLLAANGADKDEDDRAWPPFLIRLSAFYFYLSSDLSFETSPPSVPSGSQFMAGFNPVIDVDAPPQETETLVESPVSPAGTGMSVHLRQSNRFKRFSAILSVSFRPPPYFLI